MHLVNSDYGLLWSNPKVRVADRSCLEATAFLESNPPMQRVAAQPEDTDLRDSTQCAHRAAEVVLCDGRDLIRLEMENPFGAEPVRPDIVRFVSILSRCDSQAPGGRLVTIMVQLKRGFRIPSLPCSQNFCCAANPMSACFAVNAVCKHVRLDGDIHQHFGSIQHRSVFLATLHSFLRSIFGGVRSHLFTDGINHPELISNQFHSKFVSRNHCQNIRSNFRPTQSTYAVISKRRIAGPEQARTQPCPQ